EARRRRLPGDLFRGPRGAGRAHRPGGPRRCAADPGKHRSTPGPDRRAALFRRPLDRGDRRGPGNLTGHREARMDRGPRLAAPRAHALSRRLTRRVLTDAKPAAEHPLVKVTRDEPGVLLVLEGEGVRLPRAALGCVAA